MRVIAGDKRGMVLHTPKDRAIRPTSDKIKGAIFNSIQIGLADAELFVDVFAGSGAMGIEALSRGVGRAYFFDTAKESIALINQNIVKAGYQNRSTIKHTDAKSGLMQLSQLNEQADFFFMDPPYANLEQVIPLLEIISQKKLLKNDGIIMIEHQKNGIIPNECFSFEKKREKKYGITAISYYKWSNGGKKER